MKFGPLQINLAKQAKEPSTTEIGTAGTKTQFSLFQGEVIETSKIKIKDLITMRQQDGTASALYNIMTLPILANPYDFESEDDSVEAQKQRDEIKDALTRPPHKGGMTTPLELVIADMLRAIGEGWRGFEKVYRINEKGQLVYRKLASRDNQNTSILSDDRGGFNGFKQRAYIGRKYQEVIIPREKSFLFTFGKEKNWLEGESAFRAAYYHYDKKHRLYHVAHQSVQFGALPPKVLEALDRKNQNEIDSTLSAVDGLGFNSSVALPKGFKLSPYEAGKGRIDPVPIIDHHNSEMARSILAQFIMLGSGSSNSGSWALSNDQSDMFIYALRGVMRSVEQHINTYVIPDLVDFNFAKPMYPRFKYADITDTTAEMLKELSIKMFDKKGHIIPDYLIEGMVERLANTLDIEKPAGEKAKKVTQEPAKESPALSRQKEQPQFAKKKYNRDLTKAEASVNLSAISRKFDSLEEIFQKEVKTVFDKVKQDALKRLEPILDTKDISALNDYSLKYGADYARVIREQMQDAYNFGKKVTADDMGVGMPATPNESRDWIKQHAKTIQEKQFNDITFQIRATVESAYRRNQLHVSQLSASEILASIATALEVFFDEKMSLTAGAVIGVSLNLGRDDVFKDNRSQILSYQWSAILDLRTCPTCLELDGSVVDEYEKRTSKFQAGSVHFYDRCIWVAIMKDEVDPPGITGMPTEPGGIKEPSLSHTIHAHNEA